MSNEEQKNSGESSERATSEGVVPSESEVRDYLDQWSSGTVESYSDRKAVVASACDALKRWAASFLEPSLQRSLKSMPQESYEDRKKLAHFFNRECRQFGLAAECPNTGRPSLLVANLLGGRTGVGSFRFEIVDEKGKKTSKCYRSKLPDIRLLPDSEERSHWTEYMRQVKAKLNADETSRTEVVGPHTARAANQSDPARSERE